MHNEEDIDDDTVITLTDKGRAFCKILFDSDDAFKLLSIQNTDDDFLLSSLAFGVEYSDIVRNSAQKRLRDLGVDFD